MSEKIEDHKMETGAVRSADVDGMDFCSLPLLGLLGVIKNGGSGGVKYGRFNYMLGMPIHETINHVVIHLIKWLLGDRKEDHLSKVAWGAMVANQTELLNPDMAEPHLLGPGAILTDALLAELERGKAERDQRRTNGEFEELFALTLADIPQVQAILAARKPGRATKPISETLANVESSSPLSTPDSPVRGCKAAESEAAFHERMDREHEEHLDDVYRT